MEFENQYLTYNEYMQLGGTLEEAPFNILEFKAQNKIDSYTYSRLKNLDMQVKQVKLCIYELIVLLNSFSKNLSQDKNITSENIDGYSVSYAGISDTLTVAQNNQIKDIINSYLEECKLEDGTPYLYIGG